MTKDIEFIAATIAAMERGKNGDFATRFATALHFAGALEKTNPRFDRARFMRACGLEIGA